MHKNVIKIWETFGAMQFSVSMLVHGKIYNKLNYMYITIKIINKED